MREAASAMFVFYLSSREMSKRLAICGSQIILALSLYACDAPDFLIIFKSMQRAKAGKPMFAESPFTSSNRFAHLYVICALIKRFRSISARFQASHHCDDYPMSIRLCSNWLPEWINKSAHRRVLRRAECGFYFLCLFSLTTLRFAERFMKIGKQN